MRVFSSHARRRSVQLGRFPRWFLLLRPFPGFPQLGLTQPSPLITQLPPASGQLPVQRRQGFNCNLCAAISVYCMKMCRRVVVMVHLDDNSIESAEFRHFQSGLRPA